VAAFTEVLKSGKPDVVFSDFELAIRGDHGGTPTRPPALGNHHEAGPWVLDMLREYGVNILATSNNHAYDLANEGILSTLEELDRHDFPYAGSGLTAADALRSAELIVKGGKRVGLVGLVSAPTLYVYGGIATDTQMGVNAMQLTGLGGTVLPDDLAAQIAAHQEAAALQYDILISYHHNHYFQPIGGGATDEMVISDWWRNWAYTAIDNGADIYVSHGSTVLHGVDFYHGKPVLWGLGSTWFQTRKPDGSYEADAWESVIADICMDEATGETKAMRFIPITLTDQGDQGDLNSEQWMTGRGIPSLAQNERGLHILHHLQEQSNVNIVIDDKKFEAYVKFPIEPAAHAQKKHILTETNDLNGERYD
jgi:poly-gamma-glutamate synthesis protein (capsule biosynthesis protein)